MKDVCYTARTFGAEEALHVGLVSAVAENKNSALEKALSMAKTIAEKSPVAVQGTKSIIDFSRDHKIEDGLTYTAGEFDLRYSSYWITDILNSLEYGNDPVGGLFERHTVRIEETKSRVCEAIAIEHDCRYRW